MSSTLRKHKAVLPAEGRVKLCYLQNLRFCYYSDSKRSHCLGASSDEDTPDPIPNSAVKLVSADGSRKARVGQRLDNDSFFIGKLFDSAHSCVLVSLLVQRSRVLRFTVVLTAALDCIQIKQSFILEVVKN